VKFANGFFGFLKLTMFDGWRMMWWLNEDFIASCGVCFHWLNLGVLVFLVIAGGIWDLIRCYALKLIRKIWWMIFKNGIQFFILVILLEYWWSLKVKLQSTKVKNLF
jgi:hypothetical protein